MTYAFTNRATRKTQQLEGVRINIVGGAYAPPGTVLVAVYEQWTDESTGYLVGNYDTALFTEDATAVLNSHEWEDDWFDLPGDEQEIPAGVLALLAPRLIGLEQPDAVSV